MLVELDTDIDTRLQTWSAITKEAPQKFVNEILDEALEDWEDYQDALKICGEVEAGHMKVYSLAEVERHIDELNALES